MGSVAASSQVTLTCSFAGIPALTANLLLVLLLRRTRAHGRCSEKCSRLRGVQGFITGPVELRSLEGKLLNRTLEVFAMSFALYILGFVLLTAGLAYAAALANVPQQWIAVGIVVMVGLGIMSAVSRTRMRDPR